VRRSLRREALVRVELSQPRRDVFPGRRGDVSAELSQAERESGRGRGAALIMVLSFTLAASVAKRRRSGRRPRSACRSHRVQCRVGHHRCGVLPDGQCVRPQPAHPHRARSRIGAGRSRGPGHDPRRARSYLAVDSRGQRL
jgi:hypothetical protein